MTGRLGSKSWIVWVLALVALAAASAPAFPDAKVAKVADYKVTGKVLSQDGKPVEGVIVLAYHLATEELYTTTTGPGAEFMLTALPSGYYDFAAKSLDGFYVGDQVANVSPIGETKLELRLQDYSDEEKTDRWYFPGSDDKPTGIAQMFGSHDGPSFWQRPAAKYLLGGGGALALATLGGGGGEPPASAFTP